MAVQSLAGRFASGELKANVIVSKIVTALHTIVLEDFGVAAYLRCPTEVNKPHLTNAVRVNLLYFLISSGEILV
jgi:hypothetical protein